MQTNSEIKDVIIIGCGGAGCRAAIELHKAGFHPIVLSHEERTVSKTYNAQGGIQAAFGDGDSPELHFQDTLKAGNYKSNSKVVKALTENAVPTIKWLENVIKVPFDRIKGKLKLSNAGGLSKPRILSCKGSAGECIAKPLWKYIDDLGIEVKENTPVLSIDKREDSIFEIVTQSRNLKKVILCRAVILAAGGSMPKEKKIGKQRSNLNIPDGLELARQINAKIVSPSLMQYHPTGVVSPSTLRRLRLPETMRGAGAVLKNKNFKEFTNHLATRRELTNSIIKEIDNGQGVKTEDGYNGIWMDVPMIDITMGSGYTKSNFKKIYDAFMQLNYDITKKAVLVYPVLHYSLGGVEINEKAETSVTGLFAAGEVTWGVHGEDRLMGNSLLDIFVFGKIAGVSTSKYLQSIKITRS
jgi:aspartate oxidase